MEQTPRELAEERVRLAGEYQHDSEILSGILETKAVLWPELRKAVKTNAEADRAWDSTPNGINEMKLKLKLKASEKRMGSIKTLLDVMNAEARDLM
jgi:hypothetical protein